MAARSIWSGAIPLGGMFTLHVEALKGTEKYAGDESLKQVCKCHHKPFTREDHCSEGGGRRRVTRGKTTTGTVEMVMAVEKAPDVFVEVDAGELAAIEAEINSGEITPLDCIPRADLPITAIGDLAYLRPSKKIERSDEAVSAFYAYLLAEGKVLLGRWSHRGRQHVVAILPDGGALCMLRLRYAQETREPEAEALAPGKTEVPSRAVEIIDSILDFPESFNLATLEDESVPKKQAAIRAALAGELPAAPSGEVTAPTSPVPDLMAALEAAAAGKPKPKKKAKPTAAKVAAKA